MTQISRLRCASLEMTEGECSPYLLISSGPIHFDGFPVSRGVPILRVIHKLRPHACLINFNGYVVLQMQESIGDFVVKIYPEGFSKPSRYFRYGKRELLAGLWYYDYGYSHDLQYNKRIDKIIREGLS